MTSRSSRTTWARLLAALLAFTLIAAACGGSDDGDAGTDAGGGDSESSSEGGGDSEEGSEGEGESVAPTITEPAAEEGPDPGPVRGGVLRIATEADGDGLNPVANNFAVSAYLMAFPMFDPLFAFDAEGNWFPFLAESATPVDGTNSWQVKQREGEKIHDGTEMPADDKIAAKSSLAIKHRVVSEEVER